MTLQKAKVGKVIRIAVTNRHEEAAALLRNVEGIDRVELMRQNNITHIDISLSTKTKIEPSELPNRLIAQGFRINSMHAEEINLETAFMRLTKGLIS